MIYLAVDIENQHVSIFTDPCRGLGDKCNSHKIFNIYTTGWLLERSFSMNNFDGVIQNIPLCIWLWQSGLDWIRFCCLKGSHPLLLTWWCGLTPLFVWLGVFWRFGLFPFCRQLFCHHVDLWHVFLKQIFLVYSYS